MIWITPDIRNYCTPDKNGGETRLKDFYNDIKVDATKADNSVYTNIQSTELKGNSDVKD